MFFSDKPGSRRSTRRTCCSLVNSSPCVRALPANSVGKTIEQGCRWPSLVTPGVKRWTGLAARRPILVRRTGALQPALRRVNDPVGRITSISTWSNSPFRSARFGRRRQRIVPGNQCGARSRSCNRGFTPHSFAFVGQTVDLCEINAGKCSIQKRYCHIRARPGCTKLGKERITTLDIRGNGHAVSGKCQG